MSKLTAEEIQNELLQVGETGSYKVTRGSLYVQKEENANFLYVGEVEGQEEVDQIFACVQG